MKTLGNGEFKLKSALDNDNGNIIFISEKAGTWDTETNTVDETFYISTRFSSRCY